VQPVQEIFFLTTLTDTFLRFAWAISNFHIRAVFVVNSDQTLVYFSAGAMETYALIGSKQVEVVGKDEKRGFTLMVGVSISGDVLPFQAIYSGETPASLPSPGAPAYPKATGDLKFHFESSKDNNHWPTMATMKSYVTDILAPYFEFHREKFNLPNQICIWQIDCWSVHRFLEYHSWMSGTYPWICTHFVPANCTALFQPCDIGIQQVLKWQLGNLHSVTLSTHTMGQLNAGATPSQVTFEKQLPVLQDHSVGWLINGYEAINNQEIVQKVILEYASVVSICLLTNTLGI